MSRELTYMAAAVLLGLATSGTPEYSTNIDDEREEITVEARTAAEQDALIQQSSATESDTVYFRDPGSLCWLTDLDGFRTELSYACTDGMELANPGLECAADAYELAPLFAAQRQGDGSLSTPELTGEGLCVTPADLLAAAQREFDSLTIDPSPIIRQPEQDWALVNLGFVLLTDDQPLTVPTTLLGVPVEIRAIPHQFDWDPGDGTAPLTTNHPGGPHGSDAQIQHPYPQPGHFAVGLTTHWRGQFRIAGTPTWTDIPGQATTHTTTDSFEVHEAPVRLIGNQY